MGDSAISWTNKVWNPVAGCSRVSAGCEHCYAESFAARLEAMGQQRYKGLTVVGNHGARWTGDVRYVPTVLQAPLHWRKPARIFVNSMSDLFHEKISFGYTAAVFGVMAACPQHTFQVLTKRPEQAAKFFEWVAGQGQELLGQVDEDPPSGSPIPAACAIYANLSQGVEIISGDAWRAAMKAPWPLPNVHLGVSVEDQAAADKRLPILLQCPASVRWISAEPLLGPIDFGPWIERIDHCNRCEGEFGPQKIDSCPTCKPGPGLISTWGNWQAERYRTGERNPESDDGPPLHWVVVGGESGDQHRSADPAWIDSIVKQCQVAGVPVFVKQDSGLRPGKQGRLSAETWAMKQFPEVR